jgi:hypothetical protein
MGHQVHYAAGAPIPDTSYLSDNSAFTITEYSRTNSKEFAAEHFTAWAISPKKYRETDPIGYEWIDKMVSNSLLKKRFAQ